MATPETRTQLLDAAEHLFAEHGYRGTSVRAITDRAGANLAAVGYHFGSKADLLAEVCRRAVEPITSAQAAGLDRLLERTPDPAVADLVEAFVGPMFDLGGARAYRLIVTILSDPADEMRAWNGPAEDTIRDRFAAAFARALPGLPGDELWFRLRGMLAVTTVDRVQLYQNPGPAGGPESRRWAITFLTAALSAPRTP
ncbi:TetR/AcrR family transcriptional regulator [Actinoplanes sp. G11-F43]|uniref:TetR/AcrR family transcriptional regulator n=1 Tax=Actinoplanes sp. G11-F43 TaxID=3424130 RepID=UPI003D353DCB